ISVLSIPGLGDVAAPDGGLRVGAAATLSSIEKNAGVRQRYPVFTEALRVVGNVRVRNVATIGGHLAQADVHLDLPPVLLALNAAVEVRGPAGARRVALEDLLVGYYETSLAPGEVITAVDFPSPPPNLHGVYLKYCSLSPND